MNMFKRFSVHLALIFLFAFAQIGAVTHGISHIEDLAKHNQAKHNQAKHNHAKHNHAKYSQQGQNTHSEQCEQCISFAKIAGGLSAQSFVFPVLQVNSTGNIRLQTQASSQSLSAYSARAPPTITLI